MKLNTALTAQENILALIKAANPAHEFTLDNVTIGSPSATSSEGGTNNSSLVITAIANKGFSGIKTVNYRRLTISEATGPKVSDLVEVATDDTEEQVLAKVVAALGLVGEGSGLDSVILEAPTQENPGTFGIQGLKDSLLYLDPLTEITIIFPQIPLETAIASNDLGGFEPASAEELYTILFESQGVELIGDPDWLQARWQITELDGIASIFASIEEIEEGQTNGMIDLRGPAEAPVKAFGERIRSLEFGRHLFSGTPTLEHYSYAEGTIFSTIVSFPVLNAAIGHAVGESVRVVIRGDNGDGEE